MQKHSEPDTAPGPAVVEPLPQLTQDDPSRYHPTSQMQSDADEEPTLKVVSVERVID